MQIIATRVDQSDGETPLVTVTAALTTEEVTIMEAAGVDHLLPTVVRRGLATTVVEFRIRAADDGQAIDYLAKRLGFPTNVPATTVWASEPC